MLKKIAAGIFAAVLTLALMASCEGDGEATSSNGSQAEGSQAGETSSASEELTSDEAYDIFSEALVAMAEENAYDASLDVTIELGPDNFFPVEQQYQFKDTGTECEYYFYQVFNTILMNWTYYSDGVKYDVQQVGEDGEKTVTETEMSYEEFMAENDMGSIFFGSETSAEDFAEAEITEEDGVITVTMTITGITEMPDQLASYATMFGFDPATATDVVYDDMIVVLSFTRDGEFKSFGINARVAYTNGDGAATSFGLDTTITVNAVGDDVTVQKYTPDTAA